MFSQPKYKDLMEVNTNKHYYDVCDWFSSNYKNLSDQTEKIISEKLNSTKSANVVHDFVEYLVENEDLILQDRITLKAFLTYWDLFINEQLTVWWIIPLWEHAIQMYINQVLIDEENFYIPRKHHSNHNLKSHFITFENLYILDYYHTRYANFTSYTQLNINAGMVEMYIEADEEEKETFEEIYKKLGEVFLAGQEKWENEIKRIEATYLEKIKSGEIEPCGCYCEQKLDNSNIM